MEVVRQVIEDELHLSIAIAGLAKDDRHRTNELLFGFPPKVVGMKTDSELFHILTHIQDEVHRYAITFHRDLLLNTFKTVKRMREASLEALQQAIGKNKGALLYLHFHPENASAE